MKEKIKKLFQNKNFQVFIGIILIIAFLFSGTIFAINYYISEKQILIYEENIKEELIAFRKYKDKQIEKDIEKINQIVKEEEGEKYSDYNHYIDTPDKMIKSIEGGYCIEDERLFSKDWKESICNEYGEDSAQCLRQNDCDIRRYTQEGMHKLIEAHAMLENDEIRINRAKKIYDEHPNWDLYSIVLAEKNSINKRMLKEAALYVWGEPDFGKVEDKFEAVWYWDRICESPLQQYCEGMEVEGYRRDLLVFNKSGTLFYFLLDK